MSVFYHLVPTKTCSFVAPVSDDTKKQN